jgi:hypothetical protein
MDPVQPEGEVVRFFETFGPVAQSVLIGGYAVAAYGPPRFSVDVDLVLPQSAFESVSSWLTSEKFSYRVTLGSPTGADSLRKLRALKGVVSSDLYFGGVRPRESGAEIPYGWLSDRARLLRLRLRTSTTIEPVCVARPEAIWGLKLLAGRTQDLSDLLAIVQEPIDEREISTMLGSLSRPGVQRTANRILLMLESPTLYKDSLSRWSRGSPELPENQRQWRKFKDCIAGILTPLT